MIIAPILSVILCHKCVTILTQLLGCHITVRDTLAIAVAVRLVSIPSAPAVVSISGAALCGRYRPDV